jgi:DNA-binding NarL/FixJ family response regulator
MIKVLIVEDQVMLRDMLVNFLGSQDDITIVGSLTNASKALDTVRELEPDLVLLDVCTEDDASGITAAAELRAAYPAIKLIVMTGMPEITFLEQARAAGANSFIYKNISSDQLLTTIRSTMDGYETFPSKTPTNLQMEYDFTPREMDVLRLVCDARDRREIALELHLSEGTVKACISGILDKTGFESILKFAIFAVSNDYIKPNVK